MKISILRSLSLLLLAQFTFCAVSFAKFPTLPDQTPEHGGQIEAKYDGFNFETVITLREMRVVCGNGKPTESGMKGICVGLSASLHSPGQQLEYVRYAKIRLVFETKDWVARHPLGQRDLVAVVDNESIKLGRMQLAKQEMDADRGVDVLQEVLEVSIPYPTFVKMARGGTVEMKVGTTVFALKEKNLAALRDVNNRVKLQAKN